MLDQDRSLSLMQVGAGTPMGELLRRYWTPIAAVSEFDDKNTKPVRLFGENLVLYKDLSGTWGMLDRHCPHRRADLSYGYVEKHGLRCNYHGWLFGETGACLAQPYEDVEDPSGKLRKTIHVKNYPVKELSGLLWVYMGPLPAPELPVWEPFTWKNGFVQISFSEIPCNWLQCQENSIDPVHFEWMHSNWSIRLGGQTGPYIPTHTKVGFNEFEYGFQYKRIREDTNDQDPLWTVGRVCLWPNCLFTGEHFEWRVPIDDHNTLSVGWFFTRVPKDKEPYVQEKIPHWYAPIKDEKTGRWITTHVMNQDFVAWVGQGTMSDRPNEHLGRSDRGVAMVRQRLLDEIERVKRGEDPKATVRDPEVAKHIDLPIVGKEYFKNGLPSEVIRGSNAPFAHGMKRFPFLCEQPQSIKKEFEDATGFRLSDATY